MAPSFGCTQLVQAVCLEDQVSQPHSRQELPMTTKDFTPLRQRMGTQSNGQRCVRRRLDSRSDSIDRADPASDRRVYEGRCRRLRLTCGRLGEGRSAWLDEERNDISLRTRPSTFSCVTPVTPADSGWH